MTRTPNRSLGPLSVDTAEMSDGEELLADDLAIGDPCAEGAEDGYDLGNEEEEILLAGGSIADRPSVPASEAPDGDVAALGPEEAVAVPAAPAPAPDAARRQDDGKAPDQRYRASREERFPTERSGARGSDPRLIPDSLETVVTPERSNGSDGRRQFNSRNRRQGNRRQAFGDLRKIEGSKYRHQLGPAEFSGRTYEAYINANEPRNELGRNEIGDFRTNREFRHFNDSRSQPFNMPYASNFDTRNDFNFDNFVASERGRIGDFGLGSFGRGFGGFGDGGPPHGFDQMQRNSLRRSFANEFDDERPFESQPDFRLESDGRGEFDSDGFCGNGNFDSAFPPHLDRYRIPGGGPVARNEYEGRSGFDANPFDMRGGFVGNLPPPPLPPLPPFLPRENVRPPPIRVSGERSIQGPFGLNARDDFKAVPQSNETKKVLINPHFKGAVPVPHDIALQQNSQILPTFSNFDSLAADLPTHPRGSSSGYLQKRQDGNFDIGLKEQKTNIPSKIEQRNGPAISEKELEHMTQQFIEEQQRCLLRAVAAAKDNDFYAKTQRFIENTSIEHRNSIDSRDSKKEHLKRKQEEFINENRLNLKRRRASPLRSEHRSAPQSSRYRSSPYKRTRGRLSLSPTQQNRRELSGEPEDKAYRAKLREQAEMRARVLQAKERRRRKNAANLTEKSSQGTPVTLSDVAVESPNSEPSSNSNSTQRTDEEKYSLMSDDTQYSDKPASKDAISAQIVESKDLKKQTEDDKNDFENGQGKTFEEKHQETLEDMLEDDLLRLSPEDEDLLLSDDDDLTVPTKSGYPEKTKMNSSSKFERVSSHQKAVTKEIIKPTAKPNSQCQSERLNTSVKKTITDNTEDLRKKLQTKSSESSTAPLSTSSHTAVSPRRKITFSNDSSKDVHNPLMDNSNKGDKIKEPEKKSSNKWRSTFSEQKLDLTAPVAARAISAVMRNTSETSNRKVIPPKNNKIPSQTVGIQQIEIPTNTAYNGSTSDDKPSWTPGRQVVLGLSGRRVVIPPRPHRPLVVVENDEDDALEPYDEAVRSEKTVNDEKTAATVTGLPPGMTEARLLSLCGREVERVSMGAAGSADVTFSSAAACQRFVRRFHGRLVAACRLSVTIPH